MDASKQKRAFRFESYIMDWFQKEKAINISHYHLIEEQIHKGENRQGIEIKNDQMLQNTGNVFISVKKVYNQGEYQYPTGIYKKDQNDLDQCWLYVIGNKNEHWVFSSKLLRQYFEKYKPELKKGADLPKGGLEYGFVLSRELCDNMCIAQHKVQQELVL